MTSKDVTVLTRCARRKRKTKGGRFHADGPSKRMRLNGTLSAEAAKILDLYSERAGMPRSYVLDLMLALSYVIHQSGYPLFDVLQNLSAALDSDEVGPSEVFDAALEAVMSGGDDCNVSREQSTDL
jgi:hypothetical protein